MDTNVPPSTSRKRARESETESQKIKREKAAERQRRKRERDRRNSGMGIMAFSAAEENQQQAALQQQQHQHQQQEQQHLQQQQQVQTQPQPPQPEYELTAEEKARRDRVRAAARERQRKHRQLVKQRRMRDLGLDMGNEMMPGMEEVHYRATPDGQYHPVMPTELQQIPPPHPQLEAPFPHGAPMGGQTFASTLLLSFSCAPLLKQHLLRTLGMSNEELASLEPIIADAWDRWDHSRRMHYAEQVAKTGGQPPGMPPSYAVDLAQHESHSAPPAPFPHPNGPGPADPNQAAATNDFRTRFHRSIATPLGRPPFPENQTASTTTPSSTSGSTHNPETTIDPHLATNTSGSAAIGPKTEPVSVST